MHVYYNYSKERSTPLRDMRCNMRKRALMRCTMYGRAMTRMATPWSEAHAPAAFHSP